MNKTHSMNKTQSYYDLLEALDLPGCPICRLLATFTDRLFDGLIYEQINDGGLRARIRQARGFCPEHARQLVRHGAALGVAIMMRDVLNTLLEALEGTRFRSVSRLSREGLRATLTSAPSPATADVVARLGPQKPCPVCERTREMEDRLLHVFVERLDDPELATKFRASEGLCLPHLRGVLRLITDQETYETLVRTQGAIWRELLAQLNEAIRKSDYRFLDEGLGEEGKAWLRALGVIAGAQEDLHSRRR